MTTITINGRPVKARSSGRPWEPREDVAARGLPDRLLEKPVEDWRKMTWEHPDERTGVYPDAVSIFSGATGTWSGFIIEDGRAYRYEAIWYRDWPSVQVTFWRRRQTLGTISIPLSRYFVRYSGEDEPLVPGVTTIEHIQDHLDPGADVLQVQEMRAWYEAHDGSWEPPDGEYRDATSQLWDAYDAVVGPTVTAEDDDANEDAERAAMVPTDPPGLLFPELAALLGLSPTSKHTRDVVRRLVAAKLLREEDEHNRRGAPRKRYRGVDRDDSQDHSQD
jgi:hypothetical protein